MNIADATTRGWTREVERHTATLHRMEALLTELDADPDKPGQAATLDNTSRPDGWVRS